MNKSPFASDRMRGFLCSVARTACGHDKHVKQKMQIEFIASGVLQTTIVGTLLYETHNFIGSPNYAFDIMFVKGDRMMNASNNRVLSTTAKGAIRVVVSYVNSAIVIAVQNTMTGKIDERRIPIK